MDKKTIAAAVGAVMLTAAAGASTWAVVFDQQPPVPTAATEPIVTTVYIDQFGNQLDPPSLVAAPGVDEVASELVPTTASDPAATNKMPPMEQAAYQEPEEEGNYEEAAYEEHEEDEDHDSDGEHESGGEYRG